MCSYHLAIISQTKTFILIPLFHLSPQFYHILKLPVQTVTSIVLFNLTAELDSNVLPVVSGSSGCPFILISPSTLCCRGDCLGGIRHCFPDTQASHPNPLIGRHNPPIH